MDLYANTTGFKFSRARNQLVILPVCDVGRFWVNGDVFNFKSRCDPLYSFNYSEITRYNGRTTIPSKEELIREINHFLDKECG